MVRISRQDVPVLNFHLDYIGTHDRVPDFPEEWSDMTLAMAIELLKDVVAMLDGETYEPGTTEADMLAEASWLVATLAQPPAG